MTTAVMRLRKLVLDCHAAVKIQHTLTDIDKNRNWALSKVEEVVKA